MQQITVAITHQTLSLKEELELLARQTVAIGTAIKGKLATDLSGREKIDVDLLDRLGKEGGIAVVTYGKENPRWLCRFAPGTPVEPFGALRSLKMADMKELPQVLRHINTMGNTIRLLTDNESDAVLAESVRFK